MRDALRVVAVCGLGALSAVPSWSEVAPGHGGLDSSRSAAELMDVVMWGREPIGSRFALTDHHGRLRRDQDFRGQLLLVYFGFTACASLCPTDLLEIGQALRRIGASATQVTPLFITLDPARDTRPILAAYVASFHPRLIALTGTSDEIRRVADGYKVYHARVDLGGGLGYTIDHSAYIYLMDREGRYLGFLPPGTPADRIVALLQPHLKASGR